MGPLVETIGTPFRLGISRLQRAHCSAAGLEVGGEQVPELAVERVVSHEESDQRCAEAHRILTDRVPLVKLVRNANEWFGGNGCCPRQLGSHSPGIGETWDCEVDHFVRARYADPEMTFREGYIGQNVVVPKVQGLTDPIIVTLRLRPFEVPFERVVQSRDTIVIFRGNSAPLHRTTGDNAWNVELCHGDDIGQSPMEALLPDGQGFIAQPHNVAGVFNDGVALVRRKRGSRNQHDGSMGSQEAVDQASTARRAAWTTL